MKTTEITLNIPEDILYTLNEDKAGFTKMLKYYAAMELYRSHKLSMGKAAELAEMNKADFMYELGKNGIPSIDYDVQEFSEEISRIADI
jgi:predicted HTH domain antitoxin